PVLEERRAGNEQRDQVVVRVVERAAVGVGGVVGVGHGVGGGRRVAAAQLAAEHFVATLDLVPAPAFGEVGDVAGELPVVAILRVGGVEVGGVGVAAVLRQPDD